MLNQEPISLAKNQSSHIDSVLVTIVQRKIILFYYFTIFLIDRSYFPIKETDSSFLKL